MSAAYPIAGLAGLASLFPLGEDQMNVMSAVVTIYATETCGFCIRAKRLLAKKQVPFTEIDVDGRPDLRAWLRQATGQHTVPQIFINGNSVGGFTDLAALDDSGDLGLLLAQDPDKHDPVLPR